MKWLFAKAALFAILAWPLVGAGGPPVRIAQGSGAVEVQAVAPNIVRIHSQPTGNTGGFSGHPTPENYARWMEFGAFVPIFRVHGGSGEQRQPWAYEQIAEEAARKALRLRYDLMPYLYSNARTTTETGIGIVRPLVWEFPDDERCAAETRGWMFGDALFVSPIVERNLPTHCVPVLATQPSTARVPSFAVYDDDGHTYRAQFPNYLLRVHQASGSVTGEGAPLKIFTSESAFRSAGELGWFSWFDKFDPVTAVRLPIKVKARTVKLSAR